LTALQSDRERGFWNIWSRDGERLVSAATTLRMFWRSANGAGATETLHTTRRYLAPSSWSNDGRTLAFVERRDATGNDIMMLDTSGTTPRARPFLQTPAQEGFPEFSPDGRWIAYSSNRSGRAEVYVQPYPGPGPPVQVSISGGDAPAWRSDGAELFFLALRSPDTPDVVNVMAAGTEPRGETLVAGVPRRLFEGRYALTGPVRGYDVTPDGRRFLMVQQFDPAPEPPPELVLVQNWIDELRRRVPVAASAR
jgi:Tol biopolymer transport system component